MFSLNDRLEILKFNAKFQFDYGFLIIKFICEIKIFTYLKLFNNLHSLRAKSLNANHLFRFIEIKHKYV